MPRPHNQLPTAVLDPHTQRIAVPTQPLLPHRQQVQLGPQHPHHQVYGSGRRRRNAHRLRHVHQHGREQSQHLRNKSRRHSSAMMPSHALSKLPLTSSNCLRMARGLDMLRPESRLLSYLHALPRAASPHNLVRCRSVMCCSAKLTRQVVPLNHSSSAPLLIWMGREFILMQLAHLQPNRQLLLPPPQLPHTASHHQHHRNRLEQQRPAIMEHRKSPLRRRTPLKQQLQQ